MGKKRTPAILQGPLTAFIRTALALPLLLGPDAAVEAARSVARAWATGPLNRKRYPRAVRHLQEAFPEWDPDRIHQTAVQSYEHLFALGIELGYTPRLLTEEGFTRHLMFTDIRPALQRLLGDRPCILITGHCGNWELIGYAIAMLGFPLAAVYRPLDLKPLDAWVREMRARRG
ncbi:MAG: lysophospholipid acyltransferase family protein, partial [Phycisphaerales bacterium]